MMLRIATPKIIMATVPNSGTTCRLTTSPFGPLQLDSSLGKPNPLRVTCMSTGASDPKTDVMCLPVPSC